MCACGCVCARPLGKLSLVAKRAKQLLSPFLKKKKRKQELPRRKKKELKNLGSIFFCPSACEGLSVALGNLSADDFAQC